MKENQTAQNGKKRRLIAVLSALAGILLVLFCVCEFILPHLSAPKNDKENLPPAVSSRIFYDESRFTDQDRTEYETLNRYVYFKNHLGVETLVSDGDYESAGGAEAILFGQYIESIRNGDNIAYAACFSDQYDFENGIDRFADGTEEFPPQRLYDIHIESLDTLSDEESGITQSLYDVRYRIYKNTGDFRNDMVDDTAPLLFLVETRGGKTSILDIRYRYGNDQAQ